MTTFAKIIPRGLIVSCQATRGDVLYGPEHMAAMALAAERGGAVAIRADGSKNISAIRSVSQLPIVGIKKTLYPTSEIYITPTFADAREAAEAGADVVALDATSRPRPRGETLPTLIERIRLELNMVVMADVSTVNEGIQAVKFGADAVATTLSGYVDGNAKVEDPDIELVKCLADRISKPVIAEGRYYTPSDAARALATGAYGVVVGSAITRPQHITERFVSAMLDGLN